MRYRIIPTSNFKKDYKRVKSRGLNIDLLDEVIDILAEGLQLNEKYKDHQLSGN